MKNVNTLRGHIRNVHLKIKKNLSIECLICNEKFTYYRKKDRHMLIKHGIAKGKIKYDEYACDVCLKRFPRKNTLAEHMLDSHIEKKCFYCDLNFTRKTILFHLNQKHGHSIPTCGVCGLKSTQESKILNHQRKVHMKEKNIACELCEMAFYSRSHLESHMIKHSNKKKYRCNICGKLFARKVSFDEHCLIHTGEKKYACNFCQLRFTQRGSLRCHIKKRHSAHKITRNQSL